MTYKIEFDRIVINDNEITVSSPSTSWFNEPFAPKIDIKNLLKRYNDIVKLARSKGTVVSQKYKTKQQIINTADDYNSAFNIYLENFQSLKVLVESKVKKGFSCPASDDEELNRLYVKRNAIMAMFYGGQPMDIIRCIEHKISEFERDYHHGDVYTKIYL